jgi:hypothetical protein
MSEKPTGIKELYYLCLLPADKLADQICSLPYTMIESIIEDALTDEDWMFDLLTNSIVEKLKKEMHLYLSKKALRKILKVRQILNCVGYFDFGDWDVIRDEGNPATNAEPPKVDPPKIVKDLIDAGQLDDTPADDGRYKPLKSMPKFIQWCCDNNYGDDISVKFILKYIYFRGNAPRTIEMYISKARKGEIKTQ